MSKEYKTIGIKPETKEELDAFFNYYAQIIAKIFEKPVHKLSYDDVIRFLLKHVKIPESPLIKP